MDQQVLVREGKPIQSMTPAIRMPERGIFIVDDDPQNVIATALAIATSPLAAPVRHRQLAPGGDGLDVENVGWIGRVGADNDGEDDTPEDTWTLCRVPDAKRVIEGTDLRALVEEAYALRVAFPRVVTMDRWGNFTVTDDERNTIGTALVVATAPQHAGVVEGALRRGASLNVPGIGGMFRLRHRQDLSYPFSEDPTLDPSTRELWYLGRESDSDYGGYSSLVITGDELRVLVQRALALREGFHAAPLP